MGMVWNFNFSSAIGLLFIYQAVPQENSLISLKSVLPCSKTLGCPIGKAGGGNSCLVTFEGALLCRYFLLAIALLNMLPTSNYLPRMHILLLSRCREMVRNSPTALRILKAAMNAAEDGQAGIQVELSICMVL